MLLCGAVESVNPYEHCWSKCLFYLQQVHLCVGKVPAGAAQRSCYACTPLLKWMRLSNPELEP
jgi:hypothetical protein